MAVGSRITLELKMWIKESFGVAGSERKEVRAMEW